MNLTTANVSNTSATSNVYIKLDTIHILGEVLEDRTNRTGSASSKFLYEFGSKNKKLQTVMLVAMLDDFEIIKLLQSVIHHWIGILLRYIMVSVAWPYVN